jgi:hypothetical protein
MMAPSDVGWTPRPSLGARWASWRRLDRGWRLRLSPVDCDLGRVAERSYRCSVPERGGISPHHSGRDAIGTSNGSTSSNINGSLRQGRCCSGCEMCAGSDLMPAPSRSVRPNKRCIELGCAARGWGKSSKCPPGSPTGLSPWWLRRIRQSRLASRSTSSRSTADRALFRDNRLERFVMFLAPMTVSPC